MAIECFRAVTDLHTTAKTQWGGPNTERLKDCWARAIDDRNGTQFCRMGATSPPSPLGFHSDDKNSDRRPEVACLSTIRGNRRIAVNGQNKKALDQLEQRLISTTDLQADLMGAYEMVDESRRSVGPSLHDGSSFLLSGVPVVSNRCNLDPTAYIQPVLWAISRLAERFDLNMFEIVSCALAAGFVADTKIYMAVAAELLCNSPDYKRNSMIGRDLALLACSIRDDDVRSSVNINTARFRRRVPPKVPREEKFYNLTHYVTVLCLLVWKGYVAPAKSVQGKTYEDLSRRLKDKVSGFGPLVVTYQLFELSCIGLMPSWVGHHCEIVEDGASRYLDYFRSKYRMKDELKGENLKRFVKAVSHQLSERFDIEVDIRFVKNLMCKTYRLFNKGDGKFVDCLLRGQSLFTFPGGCGGSSCVVLDVDGNEQHLEGAAVINYFPIGGGYDTLQQFVQQLEMEENMPQESYLDTYVLPRCLLHPTSKFVLDFEVHPIENNPIITRRILSRVQRR